MEPFLKDEEEEVTKMVLKKSNTFSSQDTYFHYKYEDLEEKPNIARFNKAIMKTNAFFSFITIILEYPKLFTRNVQMYNVDNNK